MNIKVNALANYVGQGYSITAGLLVTPLYLRYLGAEAFGLIGFFTLLQAWLSLLDMGLSPTLGRQIAYARGGGDKFGHLVKILKSFEVIFIFLALFVVLSSFLSGHWISRNWLNVSILTDETLVFCLRVMGIIIGIRFYMSLYRSGISGLEDQIWLNSFNVIAVSAKFFGALIIMAIWSTDIRLYFTYQLFITIVELFVLYHRLSRKLPKTSFSQNLFAFDLNAVKSVLPFSISIAYTAVIWLFITQSDKLILSGILSLTEYGYFTLVALISGGITILSLPMAQALLPRITILFAQKNLTQMKRTYCDASQVVTLICVSLSVFLGTNSQPLIYAWTGDMVAAKWGAECLIWFALGNAVLAISSFQYYLQSSIGDLRLHVLGTTVSAIIQIPIVIWSAINYGATGAGIAWFLLRVVWFIIWMPIVHQKFFPGMHLRWLVKEIAPIILTIIIASKVSSEIFAISMDGDRLMLLFDLLLNATLLLFISALGTPVIWKLIINIIKSGVK